MTATQQHATLRPTMHNGRITGYVVEFPDSDCCAEFHSGTDEENRKWAQAFLDKCTG